MILRSYQPSYLSWGCGKLRHKNHGGWLARCDFFGGQLVVRICHLERQPCKIQTDRHPRDNCIDSSGPYSKGKGSGQNTRQNRCTLREVWASSGTTMESADWVMSIQDQYEFRNAQLFGACRLLCFGLAFCITSSPTYPWKGVGDDSKERNAIHELLYANKQIWGTRGEYVYSSKGKCAIGSSNSLYSG